MDQNYLLTPGTRIKTQSLGECQVDMLLGRGGHGEVYLAKVGSKSMALMWYSPTAATPWQRSILELLVKKGAPNSTFLWPLDLAFEPATGSFGYLLPLRDAACKDLRHVLGGRYKVSYHARARAGRELAEAFLKLHAKGLCYLDLNVGDVFIEPDTGHVLMGGVDKVCGINKVPASVLGTPGFMAPEVYRRQSRPSTQAELHSLAVLFFLLFVGADPFLGRREAAFEFFDDAAMLELYGTKLVFIYDPNDTSNRPIQGDEFHLNALSYWPILPKFVQELFIQTFTAGVKNPSKRVGEEQWRDAMIRLADCIVYCPKCKAENFWDPSYSEQKGGAPLQCRSCNHSVPLPPWLDFGNDQCVMLNWNTKLFAHHLDGSYEFGSPAAEVIQKEGQWGLMNLTQTKWVVNEPDGSRKESLPGRPIRLVPGRQVNFGKKQALVQFQPRRPLHFIWLVDCSGSMADGGKMQSLNEAIRQAIPAMRDAAAQNPHCELLVRAIKFSSGAQWHLAQPTPVEGFEWTDLEAGGVRDLGAALSMVAQELKNMPRHSPPPVLVLLTDGAPTDDFAKGMEDLLKEPWGKRAVRLAAAIGGDVPIDIVKDFVVNPDMPQAAKKEIQGTRVVKAENAQQMVNLIQW